MVSNLDQPMTKEESYVQRRQLFRGIWETALSIKGHEDILKKPKVIKTLRMDEIGKCPIGKSKKDRIKNLRHVCNRILDFCNRQEADDVFYEKLQTAAAGVDTTNKTNKPSLYNEPLTKKKKLKGRVKRKIKKSKSMTENFQPDVAAVARFENNVIVSESDAKSDTKSDDSSSVTDSDKPKKRKIVKRKTRKMKTGKSMPIKTNDWKEGTATKRKSIKRKGLKKLKTASPKLSPQIISI